MTATATEFDPTLYVDGVLTDPDTWVTLWDVDEGTVWASPAGRRVRAAVSACHDGPLLPSIRAAVRI